MSASLSQCSPGLSHAQINLCFYGQCKDVPRTGFFKTSIVEQMSDSLASVHQQQNKQAIISVAKNEITKSPRNKAIISWSTL